MSTKKEIKEEKKKKWEAYKKKRLEWYDAYCERKMERLKNIENKKLDSELKLESKLKSEPKEPKDTENIKEYNTYCRGGGCMPFCFKNILNKMRNK